MMNAGNYCMSVLTASRHLTLTELKLDQPYLEELTMKTDSTPITQPIEDLETTQKSHLNKALWAVPLLLAVVIGLFTIDGKFVQDDYAAIQINPLVMGDLHYLESFRRDFWGIPIDKEVFVWRPLLPMIWKAIWNMKPQDPLLFRVLSLLLHMAATATVLLIGNKFIRDKKVLLTTGAIFAVHAVHSEAIGGIVSQADILSTTLGLLAIFFALAPSRILRTTFAVILLTLACLAKESAVVFGAVIIIMLLAEKDHQFTEKLFLLVAVSMVTIFMIAFQLSLHRLAPGAGLDNLARDAHGWDRILYGLYIVGRGITMCFIPVGLAPSHAYAAVDFQLATLLPYAIPGLIFLICGMVLFAWALKTRNTAWIVGLGLLFGPVLMNSNLIVRVTTDLAERLFYPASAAASAMIALLLHRLFKRSKLRWYATALVLVLLLLQSWHVQRPWRNSVQLFKYAVEAEPLSWRARNHLSLHLLKDGIIEGAWHHMIGKYLMACYYENRKTDFSHIFALEQIPLAQRLLEAPTILNPASPCTLVAYFLRDMKSYSQKFVEDIMPYYSQRYGECVERGLNILSSQDAQAKLRQPEVQ
jgi:hypothetical protein